MHVTKVERLYDSLNYEAEFNQGDRLFDSQPRSFISRPKYQQYLQGFFI